MFGSISAAAASELGDTHRGVEEAVSVEHDLASRARSPRDPASLTVALSSQIKGAKRENGARRRSQQSRAYCSFPGFSRTPPPSPRGFGANFTITNTRPSYAGGKASSTYQLELNNTILNIGDPSTPRGTPCFRTALSTGDKSTLALAFFLARLQQEDLSARCVVIDDPLTSLDSFRTACTQQEIAALVARAAQTVVLSHDPFFLKGILDSSERATTRCLQVVRDGDSYILRAWNVADYFLREAHEEYFLMKSYLADGPPENGDLTSIARPIRPYVEGHLRNRFPDEFAPTEWLGDFIPKVKQAAPGSPLAGIAPKVPEMEAINEYSKRFHHTQATPAPRPTDAELQPWVKRAIVFVQTP